MRGKWSVRRGGRTCGKSLPGCVVFLQLLVDVAFDSGIVVFVFPLQVCDEEDVIPHVVLNLDVAQEPGPAV